MRRLRVVRNLTVTTAICTRCGLDFRYFRRGKHRRYCEPCRELEKQDYNDFHNGKRKSEKVHLNA